MASLGPVTTKKPCRNRIDWDGKNSIHHCDFRGNDLSNVPSSGENCSGICRNTPGCTHFTWKTYNGGTCYMKQGPVSRCDADTTDDKHMQCGAVEWSD